MCVCVCVYVCACVGMHACMCVCVYVCVNITVTLPDFNVPQHLNTNPRTIQSKINLQSQYLPAALKPTPAGAASPSKVLSPTSALTPGVPKVIPLSPGKAADSSLLSAVAGMGIAPKLLAPPNTNTNPKGSDSASESSSSVTQETNGTGKFMIRYDMTVYGHIYS